MYYQLVFFVAYWSLYKCRNYFDYKQLMQMIIWIHTPLVSSFKTLESSSSIQGRTRRNKSSQALVFDSDDDEEEIERQINEINLPSPLPFEDSDNDSNISEVFEANQPPLAGEDLGDTNSTGRGEWTYIMLLFRYTSTIFFINLMV